MSDEKNATPEFHLSESHPRLLDIDDSLKEINKIEHSEHHVALFTHEKEAPSDPMKPLEVSVSFS